MTHVHKASEEEAAKPSEAPVLVAAQFQTSFQLGSDSISTVLSGGAGDFLSLNHKSMKDLASISMSCNSTF